MPPKTNIITSTLVIIALFTAYSFGQANQKPPVKNCCCEHTQQIAEDLRWIREKLSKPYTPPPHRDFNDIPDITVPDMGGHKPKDVKFNFPKR